MKTFDHIVRRAVAIFAAAMPIAAVAQPSLAIRDVAVWRDRDSVRVTMRVRVPERFAPRGITRIWSPVITDGRWRVSLPAIVVQGRGAAVAWQRHEWAARMESRLPEAVALRPGTTFDYRAAVALQPWMRGSRIETETLWAGCGGEPQLDRSIIAARIIPPDPPPPPPPVPELKPTTEPTVGELLAQTFPFVLPATELNPIEPIRFYDDERDNALTVYFHINRHDIEPGYVGNRQTLVNLLAAIETISSADGVAIERVVVAGFASPEGPFDFNDRLAWNRAVSVKRYILDRSPLKDRDVMIFNGSLDWRGLSRAVAADRGVPAREEVLRLLEGVRELTPARQGAVIRRLRTLDSGRTWRHLTDHIFPLLRNGTFIRVYFNDSPRNM
jgi:outer membrane protein OmpA-like peptidoglycan-associated protein